jgi:tRNA-dihydrouridine synthase A
LGLFQGQSGGKRFRRHLSEQAHRAGSGLDVLQAAAALVGSSQKADNTLEEAS